MDDFRDGIKIFLNGKVVFVVDSIKEVGSFLGSDKIWGVREIDGKRVELGLRSKGLFVINLFVRCNSLFLFLF